MEEDEELQKLREEKMKEMQEGSERQEEAVEKRKEQLWTQAKEYLKEGAFDRLSNIRTVDESKAYSVAQQIVALGKRGQIKEVDEAQMKDILREIQKDREENQGNIKFRK